MSFVAEWAIARLQIEGARQERYKAQGEEITKENSDHDTITENSAFNTIRGFYNCISGKHSGKLFVTSSGVQFREAIGTKHHWELCYDDIHLIQKVMRITSILQSHSRCRTSMLIISQVNQPVKLSSGQGLTVTDKRHNEYVITEALHRDKAFTQIVGYSKFKWQVVG